jgi:hypothetical protein
MTPEMTKDQMLARADHIFIGVIEKQEHENWPLFRVPGYSLGDWAVFRMRVHVEMVLRGTEPRSVVDIYEIIVNRGGVSGDWNLTLDGHRYLFPVRVENGRYHVVRDWWRSIFRIYSGKHSRLPMDDGHPLWERIGLLTWWPAEGAGFGDSNRMDPGQALGRWRAAKLARGLVRHPDRETRVFGCQALVYSGPLQDECWEQLSSEDRAIWSAHGLAAPDQFLEQRRNPDRAIMGFWDRGASENDVNTLRLLTTVNRPTLRREFCRLFTQRFPNDHDNGCPADQSPPATIVTQDGDVPLIGTWPTGKDIK